MVKFHETLITALKLSVTAGMYPGRALIFKHQGRIVLSALQTQSVAIKGDCQQGGAWRELPV